MVDKWLLISMASMLTSGVYGGKWNDSSGWIDAGSGTFSDAARLREATTVRDVSAKDKKAKEERGR